MFVHEVRWAGDVVTDHLMTVSNEMQAAWEPIKYENHIVGVAVSGKVVILMGVNRAKTLLSMSETLSVLVWRGR